VRIGPNIAKLPEFAKREAGGRNQRNNTAALALQSCRTE